MNSDTSQELQQRVLDAYDHDKSLRIVGSDTKGFYGRQVDGEELCISEHQGILSYEPTELVIKARAGTTIREIQNALDEKAQMLAFEPPMFEDRATLGGSIACNMSGPRRAFSGAARDFVLGTKIINGKGKILSFGGEVMKNVAGYDVSRLMTGAFGTLGLLLEVSLKVIPKPELEQTLVLECDIDRALAMMHEWAQKPIPISATCFADGQLVIRLSGASKAVEAATTLIGGLELGDARNFWSDLLEQRLSFFNQEENLWRISIGSDVPPLAIDGDWLYEWNGALRWFKSKADAKMVLSTAAEFGGHATLYRSVDQRQDVFQPLSPALLKIHQNLKQAFDPKSILNPGRMYAEL